jgi:quercetin dioxygenase-like cupin family protein
MTDEPIVVHVDDLDWYEVRAQQIGDRRASVWNRFADVTDNHTIVYTRYDPGAILAKHWHSCDEVIYVLEGAITLGERHCPQGSVIVLDAGTPIGPIITGDEGAFIFEVFNGQAPRAGQDRTGYDELLRSRGVADLPSPAFEMPADRMR